MKMNQSYNNISPGGGIITKNLIRGSKIIRISFIVFFTIVFIILCVPNFNADKVEKKDMQIDPNEHIGESISATDIDDEISIQISSDILVNVYILADKDYWVFPDPDFSKAKSGLKLRMEHLLEAIQLKIEKKVNLKRKIAFGRADEVLKETIAETDPGLIVYQSKYVPHDPLDSMADEIARHESQIPVLIVWD